MRLLVTRPEPEGERTAARLRARGHEVLAGAAVADRAVTDPVFGAGPWSGVAFTCANAVRAVDLAPPVCRARRAAPPTRWAREPGTRRSLRVSPGRSSAEGDVEDLVRLIEAEADCLLPILYFAGSERAGDLEAALAPTGRSVETVIAYRARLVSDFDADVRDAIARRRIEAVLHYSARSAAAFLAAAEATGPRGLCQRRQALLPVGRGRGAACHGLCPQRAHRRGARRERTHRPDREGVKIKS